MALLHQSQDEILRLRKNLKHQANNEETVRELIDKLDKAFEELSSMNSRLIRYMEENHGLQDTVSSLREENRDLKKLLESMDQQLRLANEAKLHKGKRFGRKSETAKSLNLKEAKDREEDKSDFDGTPPPAQENSDETNPDSDSTVSSEQKKEYSNPRTSYGKKTIVADKVVLHYCSQEAIPAGAHVLEERVHIVYEYKMEVIEHRYISYRVVENGGTPYEVPYVSNDPLDTFGSKACMIEGCPADVSLLAMILTNKYQFHLPVQRQVEMLASYGLKISKSTLNHWLHKAIKQLRPLEDAIKTQLLEAGSYLFCDETSELVCVKDAKTGEMHYRKKYVWGIVNTVKKLVYYLYEEGSRARKVIGNFLSGFKGAIKTDGYNAYKMFEGETEENITRTGCMAHVRRKFLEALVSDERSRPFIEKISRLYWVEAEARIDKLQAHQVQKLRKEKSVPILGDLYSQIESLYHDKLTRYSDLLRKAINYAYHEWKAVVRYIENGNWSIDNNEGERRMKPVVLGRKNYMNYGSHQGASNGAYMYTLVESCKMSGGSPVAYIKDVLCSLIKGETDYLQLIPCNWVNNK